MKSKLYLCLLCAFLYTAIGVKAQKPVYPVPNSIDQIPFGKKLPPPPALTPKLNAAYVGNGDKNLVGNQYTTFDPVTKMFKFVNSAGMIDHYSAVTGKTSQGQSLQPQKSMLDGFHLAEDINTHAQPLSSYPHNVRAYPNKDNFYLSFAVLNDVGYFVADDGIHGGELWRSDGTAGGTFMVKDINPGTAGSNPVSIIAANGKLFFSAFTDATSWAPWISDGTEMGTTLIKNIGGIPDNYPITLLQVNNNIFFSANSDFGSKLWKTDGTPDGTSLVYDFNATDQYAGYITEPTAAKGLYFFSAWTPAHGRELWRSDGTKAGTFLVEDIGPDQSDYYSPLQLTAYKNKLYFSGDDGSGRKLWVSDGTADGTSNVSGNNQIFLQTDFLDYTFNVPFPVLNNVLYCAGYSYFEGNGLFRHDASTGEGLVLVKDLTPFFDQDYIVPTALIKVGNSLYFKAINSIGGFHDDLWISKGKEENTQIVKAFDPGRVTTNYYNGFGTLYFNEDDSTNETELWKSNGTEASTNIVKDIFPGNMGSGPAFLTPVNGKILFNATDPQYGTELWATDGTDMGTALVKNVNSVAPTITDGSDAGFFYKGIGSNGNLVLFGAFTPEFGGELYKSDGTHRGTYLLNDIWKGPDWSYPNSFRFKNGVSYFIDDNSTGTAVYKTDGTKAGLRQVVYNIDRIVYYVTNFNVTDNGLVFYLLFNRNTGQYELWRSDGTQTGTFLLNTSLYYNNYIVTVGNMAYFVSGDLDHGYELWESDGTTVGTKMVKDINAGFNGSYPYSLFAYKNELYFGAGDGGLQNSFWKTDGTVKGTVKLKNVAPGFYDYNNFFNVQLFCISNNILYFGAFDFNAYGAEVWKTDGTKRGTKMVKNININNSSYPAYLTDVDGTLYFMADDGIHGRELWSSKGNPGDTKLVKDIGPDINGSNLGDFCSAGGKLYFLNNGTFPNTLWSSDGTDRNTIQVADDGLNGLFNLTALTPAGNKLFFGAYSAKYGNELYEGDITATTFAAARVNSPDFPAVKTNTLFEVLLYPNPAHGTAGLQVKGGAKNIAITIADISGKTIWQHNFNNRQTINIPVEKMSPGIYLVTVKTDIGSKTLKLLKN